MPPSLGGKTEKDANKMVNDLLLDAATTPDADAAWDGPIRYGFGPTATQQRVIDAILTPIVTEAVEDEDIDVDLVIEPVVDTVATDVVIVAAPAADRVYALAGDGPKPKAGFETILVAEMAKGPGTAADLVARMLASGEFVRVAPKAAANRPLKPTNFLLKTWTVAGTVVAS